MCTFPQTVEANARATLPTMTARPAADPTSPLPQEPHLRDLSAAQARAVTHGEGPLLILAGPGSGKTRVIAHRIAYLTAAGGVAPWQLMAVTFTNKAAREMQGRVDNLLGREAEGITLGTFHAICVRILRSDGRAIDIPRGFTIFDAADQLALVKQAVADLGLDPKQTSPRALLHNVSRAKSENTSVEQYQERVGGYFEEITARVYERYQAMLTASNALDFDDLLLRTLHLFDAAPAVRERYQSRFRHVLVDEFQDTNLVQYQLARLWAGGSGNLTVVGDPDQSIYSWRAADIRNILFFQRDYPDATVVRLEQNYRSTQSILRAADAVIQKATERLHKSLWTENEAGPLPVAYEAYTEAEEAEFVVQEITRHVAVGEWKPGDAAVMYRTNAQSRVVEETFLRAGLPYRLVGATRFYERREIKDLLAYLRLVHNPADVVSFERVINVPGRGAGKRTLAVLLEWAGERGAPPLDAVAALGAADGPRVPARAVEPLRAFAALIDEARDLAGRATVNEVLASLLRETGYQEYLFREFDDAEERWENVQEFGTVAANYDQLEPGLALATFLENVALVSDVDALADGPPDATTLITLHAAKGLEFPVVFLIGLEEGVLPHQRSFDDPDSLEEERRLCYVGITRAQRCLYLVYAFRRAFAGMAGHNPASRFLADIPDDALERRGRAPTGAPTGSPTSAAGRSDRPPPPAGRPLRWNDYDGVDVEQPVLNLAVGDRVRHRGFGTGVIVACSDSHGDHEVTVDFDDAGVRKLLVSLAPLEKL